MIPYILIAFCVLIPACICAYCYGYSAGVMSGFRASGMGTRIDSRRPVCGRSWRQIGQKSRHV